MANREHHGSKGSMHLKRDWEESSSGHVEHFDDLILEATLDGNGVTLIKREGTENFIRNADTSLRETKTVISVQELVRLIEQYGTHA